MRLICGLESADNLSQLPNYNILINERENVMKKRLFVCLLVLFCIVGTWQTPCIVAQAAQSKILVVIDPGHTAYYNAGCVSGYYEGNWAMQQALYEKAALEAYGFDVIITRDANGNPGLYDRGQIAVKNSAGYSAVVFMSNHTNAYGAYNPDASGVSAITSKYLSSSNTALIHKVMNAVAAEMNKTTGNTYVRGIETRLLDDGTDWYGVIRGSVSGSTSAAQAAAGPVQYSFILEHGFHTNVKECTYLSSDANIKSLAAAKAKAFAEFFGLIPSSGSISSGSTSSSTTTTVTENQCWNATVSVAEDDPLNMRSAANSDSSNVVMQLGNGNRVTVLGEAVNAKYGDLWFYVLAGSQKGFVHSTYLVPDYILGAATSKSYTGVYADKGTTPLLAWPQLGPGNRVVVYSKEGDWYRVQIAGKYVGYVLASQLVLD